MTAPPGPRAEPGTYGQGPFTPPPGASELILVRHGQTEAYVDGTPFPLVGGHGDPPLSAHGHEQARQVCSRLASTGVSAIYVTTLVRTVQTAEPLARELRLPATVEPGLREVNLGAWEGGLYRKMLADRHPTAREVFTQERWEVIPGAEPSAAFADRVRDAVQRLAAAHPGQRVAAFTHGGVIAEALALATGSRAFAFLTADNASISRLIVSGGQWILRGFNDTAHLDPRGR